MAPAIRHMPRSMKCRICGREVRVGDELGWAIVELREVVKLSPPEFVPKEFYVHMECAETAPLLANELP